MSELKQNLKKYWTEKLVDSITLILFVIALFLAVPYSFVINKIVGVLAFGIIIAAFYFASKLTAKKFEKWVVPEIKAHQLFLFNLNDTFYRSIILFIIALIVSWSGISKWALIFFLGIFAWREIHKWRASKS